jgi:maleate isomerase
MTAEIRLGIIVPSVNIVVEQWYPQVMPAGIGVHFARMLLADRGGPDKIIEMDKTDGVRAIHQLKSARPHAIAYGCTASSVVQGHAYDAHLRAEITKIAGVPATTATFSLLSACQALGMKRVTAVSPYTETIDTLEHKFFEEGGIEIAAGDHLGIDEGFRLAEPGLDEIVDLALGAWDPSSDGIMIACLNFRSHLAIEAIEQRIGKPVISSTQAVLWHVMRLAGVDAKIPGCGRLLREH